MRISLILRQLREIRGIENGLSMSVKDLRDALSLMDNNVKVVVHLESDAGSQYFEIDDFSLSKGTPRRHEHGRAGFAFEKVGPETLLFIGISSADA